MKALANINPCSYSPELCQRAKSMLGTSTLGVPKAAAAKLEPTLAPAVASSYMAQLTQSISNGLTSTKEGALSLGNKALSFVPESVSNAAAFGYGKAASVVGSGYEMGSNFVQGSVSFVKTSGNRALEYAQAGCQKAADAGSAVLSAGKTGVDFVTTKVSNGAQFVAQYLPSGKTVLIGTAATVALATLFIGYKAYAAHNAAKETQNEKEDFLIGVRQNDLQSMNRASNGLGGFKGQIVSRAQFAFAIFANMVNVVKNVALLAFATVKAPFSAAARQEAKACAKSIGLGIVNVPVSVVGTLVPELGRLAFEGELKLATGVVPSRTDRQIFSA